MFQKTVASVATALMLMVPSVVSARQEVRSGHGPEPICVLLPVSTDAKDIHIGTTHHHLPGRSNIRGCALVDTRVNGTPTVTPYDDCGNTCFAVRVADVQAFADLKVEIQYTEDGVDKSIAVDPDPADVTREVDEVCISNHSADAPDPCRIHLTSPSDLRAVGDVRNVVLRWKAGGETYGRDVATTYEIWRSTTGDLDTFEMVAAEVPSTKYVDGGLARDTTYWYFVVAVDDQGNRSGGSNVEGATTR